MNTLAATGTSTTDLQTILYAILNSLMGLGSIVCIIFISIKGVALARASEDEEMTTAKKGLKYAILGLVICVLALVVGNAIIATAHT